MGTGAVEDAAEAATDMLGRGRRTAGGEWWTGLGRWVEVGSAGRVLSGNEGREERRAACEEGKGTDRAGRGCVLGSEYAYIYSLSVHSQSIARGQ